MINNENEQEQHNYPHHTTEGEGAKAGGYKVEDDDNLEEKDLKRNYLFGSSEVANPDKPGYESHGNGGDNFGKTNVTTSGDDAANPSQNAGYSNDYFKRTEPSEEHPENNNFKAPHQQGEPSQDGEGQSDNNTGSYQEGTSDYDGGTQRGETGSENPEQAKVGSANASEPGKADYKPEYDRGPDYGSNSPEEKGQ